jgi:hypothetical protein
VGDLDEDRGETYRDGVEIDAETAKDEIEGASARAWVYAAAI